MPNLHLAPVQGTDNDLLVRLPGPRHGTDGVPRTGLLARIRAEPGLPILVLDAPAGFGKTTLLRQLAEDDTRSVRWLALRAWHDDPALLFSSLLGALVAPDPVPPELMCGPLDSPGLLTSLVLPRLAKVLEKSAGPALVVLDGTEVLRSPDAWHVLEAFLDASPPGRTFALAGRTQPLLPLGRWVTHRRLLWLRRDDLAMSPDESRAMLASGGVEPDAATAAVLLRRSEGWPTGLRLAARWLRQGGRGLSSTFSGDAPPVRTYLSTTFLADTDPEVRRFLTRVSVLDELTGPLCDAVAETTGSGRRLEELSRSNSLVFPVGHRPDRYRMHPLFVDLLSRLRREIEPDRELVLRRRASHSTRAAGDVEAAVRHAAAAGDMDLLADLVWANVARPRPSMTDDRPLDRWLGSCSTDDLHRHPRLALAAAWHAMENGLAVDQWLVDACRDDPSEDDDPTRTSVRAGIALFRAASGSGSAAAMAGQADIAVINSGDDAWRCMACHLAGLARWLQGDRAGAARWLNEGEQLSRLLDVPSVEAQCLALRAVLAVEDEDWAAADRLSLRARKLVTDYRLHHLVTMTPVFAVTTVCLARRGDRDEAERAGQQARRLLAHALPGFPPWVHFVSRLLLGHGYLLLGDTAAARSLLSEAQAALPGAAGEPQLRGKLEQLWRLAEELPLTTTAGPSAISPAELRVVQLLPTHLSFREIGYALYLSRNTVKTQAIAAYRKLGVNSRTEAVSCARSFGLLDP